MSHQGLEAGVICEIPDNGHLGESLRFRGRGLSVKSQIMDI